MLDISRREGGLYGESLPFSREGPFLTGRTFPPPPNGHLGPREGALGYWKTVLFVFVLVVSVLIVHVVIGVRNTKKYPKDEKDAT